MSRVPYYPGCALKDRSSHLETSALAAAEKLGFALEEVPEWTCCGAVPPPSEERIMNLVAPIRILRDVQEAGDDRLVTICDFCYNSLKRANYRIRNNELDRTRVNAFLAENEPKRAYLPEPGEYTPYEGGVQVMHLMEYLRDVIGYDRIAKAVKVSLEGMNIAPYYGCVMLRPEEEMGLDDMEDPSIMEDFVRALGGTPVDYPYRTVCCGSYLSVSFPDSSTRLCHHIIESAMSHGAEAFVVSCPLCYYNLDSRQDDIAARYPGAKSIPVIYFTEMLALALGVGPETIATEKHHVDPAPFLEKVAGAAAGGDR